MSHIVFRGPKIEKKVIVSSNGGTGTTFYQAMINQQEQRNAKIKQFDLDIQAKLQRELSLLQMRSEKNQLAVKELQEEVENNNAWQSLVSQMRKIISQSGATPSLRATIETEFTSINAENDNKQRRNICEKLVAHIVNGTILPTIQEMNYIVTEFAKHSIVACPAQQITQIVNALGIAHTAVSNVMKNIESQVGCTLDSLVSQRKQLREVLQTSPLDRLEVAGRDSAICVQTARALEVTLTKNIDELQVKEKLEQDNRALVERQKTDAEAQKNAANARVGIAVQKDDAVPQCLLHVLPYIRTDASSEVWLRDIRQSAMQILLPAELDRLLAAVENNLRYAVLCASTSSSTVGTKDSTKAGPTLARVDLLLEELEMLLQAVVRGGSQAFLRVLIALNEVVLEEVQGVTSEEDVIMYAVIVCGMFRALSPNMCKQSAKVFIALVQCRSPQCVPNLLCPPSSGSNGSRICLLFAALVGHAVQAGATDLVDSDTNIAVSASSPLTAAQGWVWLHRAAQQLHILAALHKGSPPTGCTPITVKEATEQLSVSESTLASGCKNVRSFLRLAGSALCVVYQEKFIALLHAVKAAVTPISTVTDAAKLIVFIEEVISSKQVTPAFYRGQTPFMLVAASLTRYVDREKLAVSVAEQNKQSPFMQQVKALQIDRLRVIFNKLSVTPESQAVAVKSLLEKIVIANKESPDLLKYTLFKIVLNLSADCQEEFFNEMDEGHPLKLARVVCGLSGSIKELGSLFKAQFYKACPLCVPKAAEVGLTGDDFLADMGFKQKPGGVGWEDKSQWLARMSKMLCTFCVVMIQPEQHPLCLADAWAWLANIVNISTTCRGGAKEPKPPFFTATALEVMLRVTALELHRAYGKPFMALLKVVAGKVLPCLATDTPRRNELQKFLQAFISSNGTNFMSLFNKPVNS